MKVAIVGASGAVGQEFMRVLDEQNFPIDELVLFGSERSAGRIFTFRGKDHVVQLLQHNDDFKGIDIAFVSAGAGTAKEFAPTITKFGTIMIDNSSAFRMDDDVPLVVPEVNAEDALCTPRNIIANPNCTTILMVVALKPLDNISHIKNVIPHIDMFMDNGYTREETKMYNETRKIMHSDIRVSATCVRVPVIRAHSESVWIETERPITPDEARRALMGAPGVTVVDNPSCNEYPMPLYVNRQDPVYVGRIREDYSSDNGLTFWVVGDQIKKGAALNAVQIGQYLYQKGVFNKK